VRNINRTNNSEGVITHQVKVNIFYKSHVKRIRMDVCNLGKTDVILGILWLQAHNLEINWKTGKIKMIRCPLLCGKNTKGKEAKKAKKGKEVAILEKEKVVR